LLIYCSKCSLEQKLFIFNPQRNPCLQIKQNIFDLHVMLWHVVGQKFTPFKYPHKTRQRYAQKTLGQKQYLAGEVGEKCLIQL